MLESVTLHFDYCILIDGAFKNHAGKNRFSTDGSREIALSYSNVIHMDLADVTEAEKRNLYLETSAFLPLHFLLILDSDEFVRITGDFKKDAISKLDTKNNHYIYDIMSRRTQTDYVKYDPRPRLWYEPWDMEYTTCHCCYQRKDGKIRKSERPCIEGITIEHDKTYRTQQHTRDWLRFVQYQLKAESQEGVSL